MSLFYIFKRNINDSHYLLLLLLLQNNCYLSVLTEGGTKRGTKKQTEAAVTNGIPAASDLCMVFKK